MALNLGRLVAEIGVDDSDVEPGLRGTLAKVEQTMSKVEAQGKKAGDDFATAVAKATEGLPKEIAAQLDELPRNVDGTIKRTGAAFLALPADARTAARKANAYMRGELSDGKVEAVAEKVGKDAGREFAQGVKSTGDDAGKSLGKSAEDGLESADFAGAGKGAGKSFGVGLGGMAKAGVVGAAAALGLAAGLAAKEALEGAIANEQGSDRAGASLGLNEADADRLGKIAGKVYQNGFGESVTDAADSTAAVISSIKGMRTATDREVQAMTEKVGTVADVFGLDIPRVAQVAGQAVKSGLVSNTDNALDLLTKSLTKVPQNVREDLLDAVDEYGPFLESLGIGGAQAFGLLAKGADKGMYGIDKTGDALKEFTIRSTDMSTASKVGYDLLGLSQEDMTRKLLKGGDDAEGAYRRIIGGLRDIQDPAKQSQAALALFGTPLEDLSTSEIPRFLTSLDTSENKLKSWKGSTKEAGDVAYDSFGNRVESTRRRVEVWATTLADKALPYIDKLAVLLREEIQPAWERFKDTLAENEPFLREAGKLLAWIATEGFMLIASNIGMVLDAVGYLIDFLRVSAGQFFGFAEVGIQAFRFLLMVALSSFDGILLAAEKGLGWVPGLGDKIRGARRGFNDFRDGALDALDKVADDADRMRRKIEKKAEVNVDTRSAKEKIRDLRRYASRRLTAEVAIDKAVADGRDPTSVRGGAIPALAAGGIVERPTIALVGEAGPEVVRPKALDDEMRKGKAIDYDRLADAIARATGGGAPMIQHAEIRAHDYGDFTRQLRDKAGARSSGSAGMVP